MEAVAEPRADQGFDRAVLLVSEDLDLVRWVQGHAAGHGVAVANAVPEQATTLWNRAPLVLLGDDALVPLAARRPPARAHVHVVQGRGTSGPGAVQAAVGLGIASVLTPSDADRLGLLLAAVADPRPPGRVVAVVGARGGEGTTTLAAALALRAAGRGTVALLHPDPSGPRPELLLGARDPASGALTWAEVTRVGGVLAPVALREGLPRHRGVSVLGRSRTGTTALPCTARVLRTVIEVARGAFDLVVVDLDVRAGDLAVETFGVADRTWVLTRPRALGLAAARSVLDDLSPPGPKTRLVLRGDGLPDAVAARTVGIEVSHRMREDRRLDEAVDLGAGPIGGRRTPLTGACDAILTDLRAR
ncbi:septum site-determining protein Ssd [Nocardioides yefusunii]|uniref:Septum site-determining protein Ssd n=1 Tax=Nocardioides yefusunii TaxID=2500546 RepID=A0ABW1R1D0_9ACTN|nr:septum site-determining protein Ssd [Nocardioides yefusunii]